MVDPGLNDASAPLAARDEEESAVGRRATVFDQEDRRRRADERLRRCHHRKAAALRGKQIADPAAFERACDRIDRVSKR